MFGRGWGRFGRGFGFRRRWVAERLGDPDRALFGLGPCGEMAYQEYKRRKANQSSENAQA